MCPVEKALHDAILFDKFPKAVLEVYVLVLEDDGGDLEAAITCASAAIADAGVEMLDVVTAVSSGYSPESGVVLDPTSTLQRSLSATASVAFIPVTGKVTHVIVTGRGSEPNIKRMVDACLDGCSQLSAVVRTVLTTQLS